MRQGVATFCLIPNRTIIISFLYILFRKGCIKMSATELTKNLIENYGQRKVAGVYAIYCSGDNKYYIRSSVDIGKRWVGHTSLLRNKKHYNFYLQNAWNKSGEQTFSCSVVEVFEWKREDDARRSKQLSALHKRELFYIEKYDATNHKKGFNLTSVTQRGSPRLSVNLLKAGKASITFMQFKQICLLLEHRNWPLKTIAEKLNVDSSTVYKIYNRKIYADLTVGMVFKNRTLEFVDKMKAVIPKIEKDIKNGLSASDVVRKYNMPYSSSFVSAWFKKNKNLSFDSVRKEIYSFNEKGEFVKKYFQLKDAAKDVGSTTGTLIKACEAIDYHLIAGFVWSWEDKPPQMSMREKMSGKFLQNPRTNTGGGVVCFTADNNMPCAFYISMGEAEKSGNGYSVSAISQVCRTLSPTRKNPKIKLYKHCGLIWRYYDELSEEEKERCYCILTTERLNNIK